MSDTRRRARAWVVALLLLTAGAGVVLLWRRAPPPVTVSAGTFPEQLVYARTTDDVINGGVLFTAPNGLRGVAVIWVHGWGTNFYYPTYTAIGRHLAAHGLATIGVNTRMHDLGTSATYRRGRRVRGGGYWGIPSEQDLDIAAWVDFAERQGFPRVVLAGHSAGWAAVAAYRVRTRDPRVAGVVLASGTAQRMTPFQEPDVVKEARRLVDAGTGDDLIRLPNRSFPSFISAATLLDQAETPPDLLDFFGSGNGAAGMRALECPLLALYGTHGDVGGEDDLALIASAPHRLSIDNAQVETSMIDGADHMYTGAEEKVAAAISDWVNRVVRPALRE
jgi:pimeloyl-ACP methyl ester carboxylesterase